MSCLLNCFFCSCKTLSFSLSLSLSLSPSTRTRHFDPVSERAKLRASGRMGDHSIKDDDLEQIPSFPKSKDDAAFLTQVLNSNFVFSGLSNDEIHQLVQAFEQKKVSADHVIIKQGDASADGYYFYILQSGVVKFLVDDEEVMRNDEPGNSFGELALLFDSPRAATCQAVQDSVLWRVGQSAFRRVVSRHAVAQEKPADNLRKISRLFEDCDTATLRTLSDAFTTVRFKAGEQIITKGDLGELFYVIQSGTVRVRDIGTGTTKMMDQTLTEGDWFGELELKSGEPRVANVVAASDVVALALDKDRFLELLYPPLLPNFQREIRKRYLKAMPIFANSNSAFSDTELYLLVEKIQEKSFKAGEVVVDGTKSLDHRCLWAIREGNVSLFDGHNTHHLKRGDVFGDKWLNEAARRPDHTAISAKDAKATCEEDTILFVLEESDIKTAIGDLTRLGASMPYQYKGFDTTIQLKDIQKHKILGMGEFAVVYLASDRKTKKTYALKALSKLHLLEHTTNAIESTMHEKEILSSIRHPFIMGMHACFQDDQYLYLLLPLFQGGELFALIYKEDESKYGLKKDDAVFYSACVVEALSHMHSRSIVYRDLKPDNVMINSQGYAVIIDMGLAKFVVGKTYSMVGTPSYIAPEVLIGKGHNQAADFWSFGCLLYEMLEGSTPFYWEGGTQKDEFEAICKCDYKCPDPFPEDAKDLIDKLLVLDPSKRLGGAGARGHFDVMAHPWFNSINFRSLRKMEIRSPWVPEVKDSLDASNFPEYNEDEIVAPYRELSAAEQLLFKGF